MKKIFFLIAYLLTFQLYSQQITIKNIGNMGVLVGNGNTHVLIDGLHTKYGEDYLYPAQNIIDNLIHGKNGYPVAKAILFTHMHGDHFHGVPAAQFLRQNPTTILFGTEQVNSSIKGFDQNLVTISTDSYLKQTVDLGNFTITGFKMNHAGDRHATTQNLGYLIRMFDLTILHIGDTDWFEEIKMFDTLKLYDENIDIAMIPYWMISRKDAKEMVQKHIASKKLVLTHISPRIKQSDLDALKKRFPNAVFLTEQEKNYNSLTTHKKQ